jgi:hypothetical protein
MFHFENRGLGPWRIRKGGIAPGQRILVCGAHRSGTTLLGRLLCADRESLQLTEPFQPLVGVEGVDRWYIAADAPGGPRRPLIDRFLARKAMAFSTFDGRHASSWRRVKRTPRSREYAAARSESPARLVVQDPFLSLSARYFIRKHDFQAVFAVKCPAAFLSSLRRVGWGRMVQLDDLADQGVIPRAPRDRAHGPVAQTAWLWSAINRHALETRRRFPGAIAVWFHKRFCVDPDGEMPRLPRDFDIVMIPPGETIHQLVRNSAATAVSPRHASRLVQQYRP